MKLKNSKNSKKFEKLYDFQHPKEYFDDFKQNLVLRILDGRIQIFHNLKGNEYFPSEYVIDDMIKKANVKTLTVLSDYGDASAQLLKKNLGYSSLYGQTCVTTADCKENFAIGEFCNFDYGESGGFCELCPGESDQDCVYSGYSTDLGTAECKRVCVATSHGNTSAQTWTIQPVGINSGCSTVSLYGL